MASWGSDAWARAFWARETEHESALARCEEDRDRLWLRQSAQAKVLAR